VPGNWRADGQHRAGRYVGVDTEGRLLEIDSCWRPDRPAGQWRLALAPGLDNGGEAAIGDVSCADEDRPVADDVDPAALLGQLEIGDGEEIGRQKRHQPLFELHTVGAVEGLRGSGDADELRLGQRRWPSGQAGPDEQLGVVEDCRTDETHQVALA
jgi:hypothetical protein